MPRPQTKALILSESEKEYVALEQFLATLTPEQMLQPGIVGDWSVKDVLAHLHEWHQMVLRWIDASRRGETPHVPGEGYKWSQLPALNEQIFRTYADRPLDEIMKLYRDSHAQITQTIEVLDEATMFTPGLYKWMNKNTLGSYFVSATSSHYRWARKELRSGFRG
jgi:hypothetical protein